MLKVLIKKQFSEIFKTYFVNPKNGKTRSKAGTLGFFVLFAFIMFSLAALFFGVSAALGDSLFKVGLQWLYFAVMGLVSLLLGIFGSVFNTFASLYLAKDNEFLLSMPIPPMKLLISRMTGVVGLSLLYGGCVWLPACLYYWIYGKSTVSGIIFDIILTFALTLLITAITCALGWVVALISKKIKSKSFFTVILTLLFLGVYYFVCFNFQSLIKNFVKYSTDIGNGIKKYGNLFYQLGCAATGKVLPMIIFSLICIIAFLVCVIILSKSFTYITTKNDGKKKAEHKKTVSVQSNIKSALFKRELKRFTSSPVYMLNCGLGIIFLPAFGIFALIRKAKLQDLISPAFKQLPLLEKALPLAIVILITVILSTDGISTPSISLEGKHFWIIKSMPVTALQVFEAKKNLHFFLNVIPGILATLLLSLAFNLPISTAIIMSAIIYIFVLCSASYGLLLGVFRPDFTWTNEAAPIKQSLNCLMNLLIGWIISVALGAGYYFTHNFISCDTYLVVCLVILSLATRMLDNLLKTKGVEKFNSL